LLCLEAVVKCGEELACLIAVVADYPTLVADRNVIRPTKAGGPLQDVVVDFKREVFQHLRIVGLADISILLGVDVGRLVPQNFIDILRAVANHDGAVHAIVEAGLVVADDPCIFAPHISLDLALD
jgi:hypothetical protein